MSRKRICEKTLKRRAAKEMISLSGKIAAVTGGSRGIGKALCLKMAECGAVVAIVYASNDAKTNEAVEEISSFGRTAKAYKCDVRKTSR